MDRGVVSGSASGLAAGLVSGVILHYMWVLTPLPLLVGGTPSPVAGWVVHLALSLVVGIIFGAVADRLHLTGRGLFVGGIVAGVVFFAAGPLTFVPMAIGLPPQYHLLGKWLKVGAAYVAFGVILGAAHHLIQTRPIERRV